MNRALLCSNVILLFMALLFMSCSTGVGYEQYADGVAVRVNSGHAVRVRVIGDHIVRITRLPVDSLTGEMTPQGHKAKASWRVEQAEGKLIVHTIAIQTCVSLESGSVSFADADGHIILQERDSAGASFRPVQFGSRYVDAVQQVFFAADDEAFYGSGRQGPGRYAASPFMLSTRNYGVLWHNSGQPRASEKDYYFIHGNNLDAVVAGYRTLTGKSVLLDRASLALQREVAETQAGIRDWPGFKAQIQTGLNLSLSGEPYWTAELSGIIDTERRAERDECAVRAFQFATLCPQLRTHGRYPYRDRVAYYEDLRYRLLPYLHSLAGKTHFDDYTMMRALVMDFTRDKAVLNISDEYMLGPALLVAPVTEYLARNWKVYLPAGAGWYDFYTGKFYQGGQTVQAHAPLERIPLFVRAGSILPLDASGRHAQAHNEPVTLYVFTGADSSFEFYDETQDHSGQQHHPVVIPFHYDEATGTLTLGARTGASGGPVSKTFYILWVKSDRADGVGGNTRPHQTITYNGTAVIVKLMVK